jgi:hypothetical protein
MRWYLEKPNAPDRGIVRVHFDKVCSRRKADAIQGAWIRSNVGLDPVLIEGSWVWLLSARKIRAKWNGTSAVKFVFLWNDQPHKGIFPA